MSSPRPPHAGMRHVALNVIDLPMVESFYVDLLGFEVQWRHDEDNVYSITWPCMPLTILDRRLRPWRIPALLWTKLSK